MSTKLSLSPDTGTSASEPAPELIEIARSPDFLWNGAVATGGRLFASMPGWLGPTPGVVEVFPDGSFKPFPGNHWNEWAEGKDPTKHFVDVNSIIPDGKGNLWVLDAAAPHFATAIEGAVKVVQISIETGETKRVIIFDPKTAHSGTRLAHMRFHGDHAFMAESKEGSFYVIDLRDNSYRRILVGHPLMRCKPEDVPTMEGRKITLLNGKPMYIHNDLLEFGSDPDTLYFMCLFGRKIFKTHVDTFKDPSLTDSEIASRVSVAFDVGGPWVAGICRDRDGTWYLTDAENNGIRRIRPDSNGESEMVVSRPDLVWPITPSISTDGYVHFTASQLNRVPMFSGGENLVERPWHMFKIKVRD
ncbi:major royal jelly protein [Azospirillum baldaniorum]|uniref:L-dopachrome tautomerase-related protein n=1 Tax=Azospirillum baldaniorum TaxID=1064539 RepID=UPI0011A7959D|nr:L-dopachrome tautomerase-related protein [Azospirillum baldaniorum]TWA53851.1 major royal jelly protein [Azospirillum baldaniorum]